jgi:hypothetical protein
LATCRQGISGHATWATAQTDRFQHSFNLGICCCIPCTWVFAWPQMPQTKMQQCMGENVDPFIGLAAPPSIAMDAGIRANNAPSIRESPLLIPNDACSAGKWPQKGMLLQSSTGSSEFLQGWIQSNVRSARHDPTISRPYDARQITHDLGQEPVRQSGHLIARNGRLGHFEVKSSKITYQTLRRMR